MRFARVALAVAAMMLTAVFAACGDDDDDGATPTQPAANTPAGASSPGPGETQTISVIAEDFSYEPRVFEAPQGVRVIIELTNNGPSSHTLQVFEDETFSTEIPGADTDLVGPGSSAEIGVEFNEAKTYYFRCRIHPTTMQGEIEVQ